MENNDVVFMSVSEAAILFGIWNDKQEKYKGKKIVVLNRKKHRVVGAFQLIDVPVPLTEECPYCRGKGKIEIKFHERKKI